MKFIVTFSELGLPAPRRLNVRPTATTGATLDWALEILPEDLPSTIAALRQTATKLEALQEASK